MRVPFIKMHGLGNDFVVLDGREENLPELTEQIVRNLADRHTGIGCDQLILLEPSEIADFAMRIFNQDGGEVSACGNATRAVALLHGGDARIETAGGLLATSVDDDGASVDMGKPEFAWEAIPLAMPMDTRDMPVAWGPLDHPVCVNVGNPHIVFFVADAQAVALDTLGPEIEHDPLFPERINVNVATVRSDGDIDLRVWERGAGLTRACGTGACATVAAAILRGLLTNGATVHLPGGTLSVTQHDDGRLIMRGPATESYRGTFEWDDFS